MVVTSELLVACRISLERRKMDFWN